MQDKLIRLFPLPGGEEDFKGLYLSHHIHHLGDAQNPFVYANFLSSLDGRIALDAKVTDGQPYVPSQLTTEVDFRLFMELHAQADCLITHGGYLRALDEGRLGNILQIRGAELKQWRQENGLSPNPAVVIASASLDFPLPASLQENQQTVYIVTGCQADPDRIARWQDAGVKVLLAGENRMVEGKPLITELCKLGYQSIYLIAGPQMLATMVAQRQLNRFYLSMTHQLIGGVGFHSAVNGPLLEEGGNLKLEKLYFHPGFPVGSGQFFMQFYIDEPVREAN